MIKTDRREQISALFSGFEDSVLISYAEGRVGQGWCDDEKDMKSGIINAGDFYFVAGETTLAPQAAELAKGNTEAVFMPSSAEWVKALLETDGSLETTVRYRTRSPEGFDISELESFADMSGFMGFEISDINKDIYEQALSEVWSRSFVCNFLDYNNFVKYGFGRFIMHEGRLVCGASCYSSYSKGAEVEIATHPDYRKKGLATAAGAAFILECVRRGLKPHWDAANRTSLKIAEKFGFELKEEYTALQRREDI